MNEWNHLFDAATCRPGYILACLKGEIKISEPYSQSLLQNNTRRVNCFNFKKAVGATIHWACGDSCDSINRIDTSDLNRLLKSRQFLLASTRKGRNVFSSRPSWKSDHQRKGRRCEVSRGRLLQTTFSACDAVAANCAVYWDTVRKDGHHLSHNTWPTDFRTCIFSSTHHYVDIH